MISSLFRSALAFSLLAPVAASAQDLEFQMTSAELADWLSDNGFEVLSKEEVNAGYDDVATLDALADVLRGRWDGEYSDGVLRGRWDGNYTDGKNPGVWTSTAALSAASCRASVKYGQCWVFSGTMAAAARGLGIPTRSVTNVNSAHEHKPFDAVAAEDSVVSAGATKDSVWNFHVWNEAWNAYDATAQESSRRASTSSSSVWNFHVWVE